jgi:alpha-1,2-mannosyltransferase
MLSASLKHAQWLDSQRVEVYSRILLSISLIGFLGWMVLCQGLIADVGQPAGSDFMSFYAASKLALSGHGELAWHPASHAATENAIFGQDIGYYIFFYPPPYVFFCLPLAVMPYSFAFVFWTGGTMAAAIAVVRQWIRKLGSPPLSLAVMLAFPALWINAINGQNGALTTAIMALGWALLDKRQWAAGAVLGLLIIKPQLAIALPFVLVAGGRWRTVVAMGASAAGLCALSLLAFPGAWPAFLHNAPLVGDALNKGAVDAYKIQSLFAALRQWHVAIAPAYAAQALWGGGVLLAACITAYRLRPDAFALAALATLTCLMISPFLLDYDLMLTAIPLAWVALAGQKNGFAPFEKIVCFVVFLEPLIARNMAYLSHISLTPFVLMALFVVIVRRLSTGAVSA